MTVLAKAAFLWEKASDIAQQCIPGTVSPSSPYAYIPTDTRFAFLGLTQTQYASLAFERRKTELLIEGLEAYIPPTAQLVAVGTVEDVRKRIFWASVLRAAMIKLHEPVLRMNPGDDASRSKVLIAALGNFDIAIATTGKGVGFLNPFVAVSLTSFSSPRVNKIDLCWCVDSTLGSTRRVLCPVRSSTCVG
jgi:hypothetical protein